jgi:hypothetical protein
MWLSVKINRLWASKRRCVHSPKDKTRPAVDAIRTSSSRTLSIRRILGFDFPVGLAGQALVPQIGHRVLERSVTALAVDNLIATVVDIFAQVR